MIVVYLAIMFFNFYYFFSSKNRGRYLNLAVAVILLLQLI